MDERIFKVVRIIDSKSIVLNCGIEHGIKCGDKFDVFSIGKEIIDPDTNESLGTLDKVKDRLTAVSVLPKMCICQNPTSYAPLNHLYSTLSDIIANDSKVLNVDTNEMSNDLDSDNTIRIGDKARLISNESTNH